jgi:hypothetical protein
MDFDGSLIGQNRQRVIVLRLICAHDSRKGSTSGAPWGCGFGWGEDLQIELLIERRQLALCGGGEQFGGQRGEDAVIAGRMVAQGVASKSSVFIMHPRARRRLILRKTPAP